MRSGKCSCGCILRKEVNEHIVLGRLFDSSTKEAMLNTYFTVKPSNRDGIVCLMFHQNEKVWLLEMSCQSASRAGMELLSWIQSNDNQAPRLVLVDGTEIKFRRSSLSFIIALPITDESHHAVRETNFTCRELPIKTTVETKRVSFEKEAEIEKSELESLANKLLSLSSQPS